MDTIAVIGAGVMGVGIAQVAAQAGHEVLVFDTRADAAVAAKARLAKLFDKLAAKGKFTPEEGRTTLARIRPVAALEDLAGARLVIEAIVENAAAKRGLLQQLEGLVAEDCILASNTSSISITALANGLKHPRRVVGMHFFNPVPLMRLVEIVSGLETGEDVAEAVLRRAEAWGKHPVHARSTPGFIVNRIARPFYAETMLLLQERALAPRVVDAAVRAVGFRMGPCELMDLIGHDTNLAVTQSVFQANFGDKRFVPSLVQQELVDGGLLGRKSGRGFYAYADGAKAVASDEAPAPSGVAPLPDGDRIVLHGNGAAIAGWERTLADAGRAFARQPTSDWQGLEVGGAQLRLTDGRPATQIAAQGGPRDVAVFDATPVLLPAPAQGAALCWSGAACASAAWLAQVPAWLQAAGCAPQRMQDVAGLAVARTVAMIVNEACDAVQQGVCSEAAADAAMKLGVNYPAGPFEWLQRWGAPAVVAVLDHLNDVYRGERYRVSPLLRQRAWMAAIGG